MPDCIIATLFVWPHIRTGYRANTLRLLKVRLHTCPRMNKRGECTPWISLEQSGKRVFSSNEASGPQKQMRAGEPQTSPAPDASKHWNAAAPHVCACLHRAPCLKHDLLVLVFEGPMMYYEDAKSRLFAWCASCLRVPLQRAALCMGTTPSAAHASSDWSDLGASWKSTATRNSNAMK